MVYDIQLTAAAKRQFDKLPKPAQRRLSDTLTRLGNDPRPEGVVKLSGAINLYRVRCGDYRVVYQIEDGRLLIVVVKVGHRREVYRD